MLNVEKTLQERPITPQDRLRGIQGELFARGRPLTVVTEGGINHISFNVMPNLRVEETLFIKEYRIWDRYMEAIFDREYHSSMARSPDHLMFLTSLVHLQKMLYAYLCYEFGVDYDPYKPEKIKIWPTVLKIEMPQLITKTKDIVHRLRIADIFQRNEKSYYVSAVTSIEDTVSIIGEAAVYLI